MIDLNHSQNLALSRSVGCFRVPFLLPALVAALERQSLLLFGWLLLAAPVAVQAQFNYTVIDGTVTITGYTGSDLVVVIPDTITGLPVTAIDHAFEGDTNLTSVTIPNSVTSIGVDAFSSCMNLTSVTIPKSVTNIGIGALKGCSSLTSVSIPNSVTSIGIGAFSGCSGLTSFTIPNSVTNIGGSAFSYCTSLTAISVETNNPAYSSLSGVLFNQSLTTLIEYPAGKVGSYSIPNSVTSIGGIAFSYCTRLTDVIIPNSVRSIGGGAFSGCSGLTSVTIPNSVTNIGDGAFSYCTSLTVISVETNNAVYSSVDGVLFDKSQTTLIEYPSGKVGSYSLPNRVTSIGDNAFLYSINLPSVTVPNGVTNIGNNAFLGCIKLTSVTIPNSVTSIGLGAFQSTGLNSATIPNSVTNIGDNAFYYCTNLANVTIGNNVIGVAEFNGCTNLSSVAISNGVTSIGHDAFSGCSGLTSVTIPSSVTNLGPWAFAGCTALTNVTIGNSVTSVGYAAFYSCTNLTNVTIPNSVTFIGDFAFEYCTGLTGVTIGDSVTTIGNGAFYSCTSLTSVTIPNSVTSLGHNYGGGVFDAGSVFAACTNLAKVYFQGNAPRGYENDFFWDTNATAYYLPGTTGWGSTFGGIPTALWILPYPLFLNSSLGVQSSQFGFAVSWATNLSVIVEAATNMANPNWFPLATNTLTGGWFYFYDPEWTNYPKRFYRVRSK